MPTKTAESPTETAATPDAQKTYPPGHDNAVERGCLCPPWVNTYGAGLRTVVGVDPEPDEYLTHPDCRLHGTL